MATKKKKRKSKSKKKVAPAKAKKKVEWSKLLSGAVVLGGFIIAQECFALMYLCLLWSYTSTAAWLTAAVGLAEAIIGVGLQAYISLAKADHTEGGITFEKAKANGFTENEDYSTDSPPI